MRNILINQLSLEHIFERIIHKTVKYELKSHVIFLFFIEVLLDFFKTFEADPSVAGYKTSSREATRAYNFFHVHTLGSFHHKFHRIVRPFSRMEASPT